ncbi:MAG: T9SS type A sorting domain-containing protein [Bacteroidetes bacterium]|nr:T9SS type A sorting domain-containing protein [Bacteroidota bacterium]
MRLKILLVLAFLTAPKLIFSQATDLFISEYVEGSSFNKYIEIFNGTGSAINLSDYKLQRFQNGSSLVTLEYNLTGTLENGQTIVMSHKDAAVYSGVVIQNAVIDYNGDDAMALLKISTGLYVDIFGAIGSDPGDYWSAGNIVTQNKTLIRKPDVSSGVTQNPGTGFPTLGTEWIMKDQDDVSDLGQHTFEAVQAHVGTTQITLDDSFTPSQEIDVIEFTSGSKSLSEGFELFRFVIHEDGVESDGDDDLSTLLNSLVFSSTNFTSNVDSIAILNSKQQVLGTLKTETSTNFSIELNGYEIVDNTTDTLSLRVIFNSLVTDNDQISISLQQVFADESGSGFVESNGNIIESSTNESDNTLAVVATKMRASELKNPYTVNKPLVFSVEAVNEYGSLDIDYSGMLGISMGQNASDEFVYSNGSDLQQLAENGISIWTVSYPVAENITVSINNEFNTLDLDFEFIIEETNPGGENETIAPGMLGSELISYLRTNYKVTNSLGYDTARDRIFMIIDNKKTNGQGATTNTLEGVYTGRIVTGYSSRSDAQGSNFNTEHTWPQSKFGSSNPMVSDIHHLYPSDATANGARGNLPFEELDDNTEVDKWYLGTSVLTSAPAANERSNYSKLNTNTSFEPRDVHKGNVARSMFYFWTIYATNSSMVSGNDSFFNGMKNDLLTWHRFDKVDQAEVKRSDTTAYYQGNRNPFVHDTSLVIRAYFPDQYIPTRIESFEPKTELSITLNQNYPNPFNPSTQIAFSINTSSQVKLDVFDILGKRVAALVNRKLAAGEHSIQFNAANLPSGVYLYRLTTPSGILSKKMLLIK